MCKWTVKSSLFEMWLTNLALVDSAIDSFAELVFEVSFLEFNTEITLLPSSGVSSSAPYVKNI